MKIHAELAATLAAIVDEGTMEGAAFELGISQPAVSQRLRTLESVIGTALLVRSRPPRLTQAGEAVVRMARQQAFIEGETLQALGLGDTTRTTNLPIAVNSDSLSTWFFPVLTTLARELPITVELHRDDQDFTAGLLERGEVLAAVTSRREPVAGCHVTPLGLMRYRPVVTRVGYEQWFSDGVTTAALERAPLVDYDRRDDLQTRWLRSRGVDPMLPPRHRVPASHEYAEAVRHGLGWGQLLPFQDDEGLASGALVALSEETVDVPMYWQQWNLRSPMLDAVSARVVTQAANILPPISDVAQRER